MEERKNGSKYNSSTRIPAPVMAIMAAIMIIFFLVGAGGLILAFFYMLAMASLIWTGFASYGPVVGLIAFGVILCFFAVVGLFAYNMLTKDIDFGDRGDNFDNY